MSAKELGNTHPLPRPALTEGCGGGGGGHDLLRAPCVPGQTQARDTTAGTHRVPYPKDGEVLAFQLNLESLTLPRASMAASLRSSETTGKSR